MNKLKKLFQAYYFHITAVTLISLLAFVNYKYRSELAGLENLESKSDTYLTNIRYNYSLSSLSGKLFPFKSKIKDLKADESKEHNYLAVIANFRVCSTSLRNELTIINNYDALLNEKNIFPIVVFGLKSKIEKEIIIRYKKQNYLRRIPFVTVNYNKLHNFIPLLYEDGVTFIENPQYLLLNKNFQVIDTFKPPKYESSYLEEWISELIT